MALQTKRYKSTFKNVGQVLRALKSHWEYSQFLVFGIFCVMDIREIHQLLSQRLPHHLTG